LSGQSNGRLVRPPIWLTLMAAGPLVSAAPSPTGASSRVQFERDIQPILKASCYQCHGPDRQEAGLRLDSRAAAMKGGTGGPAMVPGQSVESRLLQRILGQGGGARMPLGFAPLSRPQIDLIRAWIDQGAVWPEGAGSRQHWAWHRPVRPPLPKVTKSAWVRNPIDRFVLARLEREGLQPSPAAPREALIRRVTLDLIGLPPTPREVDAFLADRSPNAYEKLVDRLLASPHYGERWARPWLDLARYADSNGYEKDVSRSIWPYRDWVINALNQDMPYDRFTIEQLAGDLLPDATRDQKIATGFHRNTMLNQEGGVDQEEQRWLTLVDRVGTTGTAWLGTTLACAQCHNHKYDPFPQKEFYRILAFFDHTEEPTLDLPSPDQEPKWKAIRAEIDTLETTVKRSPGDKKAADRLAELRKQLADLKVPSTLVMAEKADGEPAVTYTRLKGEFLRKGVRVTTGVPAVLNPFRRAWPQNRLGLAYWLVDPENPLTARVAVNRAWEQFFGRGIVETSENFGTQGQAPSHPELLDWLAVTLMARPSASQPENCGWSLKKLHRLIVTSATYRQSSRVTPALEERDPDNRLLARGPRFRMEAEMVRDSALAIGGLLSGKIGGPSVYPLQPEGIWDVPYSGEKWVISPGEDRFRRGLYTFWRRSAPYPQFVTFDATSREFCTVRRSRTDTPLQALTTLNDPAFFEAARGLAHRMMTEGGLAPADRVVYGLRLCMARKSSPAERNRLVALYRQERSRYQQDASAARAMAGEPTVGPDLAERAAWTVVANVMLNLDETLTKE
jgi:mono/diheme cytochrome c family protein